MTHQLNLTPFATDIGLTADRDGRDLVLALLKATFRFTAAGKVEIAPAAEQLPVFLADVHHGEPGTTSVRYASDVVPAKPGTDVAVNGHGYGKGRKRVEVGFGVGNAQKVSVKKVLTVFGPRAWIGGILTDIAGPVAFERMPLMYEHAFGGKYEDGAQGEVVCLENPVGVGFARTVRDKARLPDLDWVPPRYRRVKHRPPPAALGFIPAGWRQRARFAGTFDAAWSEHRRPLLPEDLDERFYNAVPQDQVLSPKLQGGERLMLLRLHPAAEEVILEMPRLRVVASFHAEDADEDIEMVADTLLVEPDDSRFSITFRAGKALDDPRELRSVVYQQAAPAGASRGRMASPR